MRTVAEIYIATSDVLEMFVLNTFLWHKTYMIYDFLIVTFPHINYTILHEINMFYSTRPETWKFLKS